jgi:hypothetical protein
MRLRALLVVAMALPTVAACGSSSGIGGGAGGSGAGGNVGNDGNDGGAVDAGPLAPFDVPLGWDAFRRWDEWPRVRLGVRAVMRSTHDPAGYNEAADASHFIARDTAGLSLALDLAGPGVLAFVRHNHWHGSPWHYQVDGHETVVQESSTPTPNTPVDGSIWQPASAFPYPLARTWSETRGADLSWVAVPFTSSFTLGYERTHYGTGYFIAQRVAEGTPVGSWNADPPPDDVVALAGRDAESLLPAGPDAQSGTVDVPTTGAVTVVDLTGPRRLRGLVLEAPSADASALGDARIRITWDDRSQPSVDAPVKLFFGTGSLFDRDGREWLVRAFPVTVHVLADRVRFTTIFPMPFQSHAHIELVGGGAAAAAGVAWTAISEADTAPPGSEALFHATYVDHGTPTPGRDLVLLDTRGVEGTADWCGSFVGTSAIFSDVANLGTLEGDPRFFFDDAESPQAQGTGTEEWGGGGDYWGGLNMTLPFAGHPVGAPSPSAALSSEDQIESLYRFLLPDLFPFGRRARIQLEHGGIDESTDHYRSVTYWYGAPAACLVRSDSMQLGDAGSEQAHGYLSPDATAPATVTTRWDLGPDTAPDGTVVLAPSSDLERHTTGTSELTLAVDPRNQGVLLRRKLDARFANQRADVFVADASDGTPGPFAHAGVWYLAGGATVLYSNPDAELGAAQTNVESPDRRWREDELLLPPALTHGRSALRVRVVFAPVHRPLTPDMPVGEEAWSEVRYDAFSYLAID